MRYLLRMSLFILAISGLFSGHVLAWEHWGGDGGGTRFSTLDQITPANVTNLVRAFEYHTGDLANRPPAAMARTKFEATPLFVEDSLVFCTPFNEVIALDPGTGEECHQSDHRHEEGTRGLPRVEVDACRARDRAHRRTSNVTCLITLGSNGR